MDPSTDEDQTNLTICVRGIDQSIGPGQLYNAFSTFGNIREIQLPTDTTKQHEERKYSHDPHRGYGFIQYVTKSDAFDAIDNMHDNVLPEAPEKVISVSFSRRQKKNTPMDSRRPVWADEEWLREHSGPNTESTPASAPAVAAPS